ncbi:MAG: 1-acyl-sn-glycerol-3-phosphate acyltransferase [Oscillospiraceae bacterium]|nr:1-acyl-sn-glycerol-3-phosphate acyltransferase [Oscillospiraceae bacterium]
MYLIARKIVEIYIRSKFKIHIHNREKIPAPKIARKGGFIIACNHQYYWDPPAVAALVKGKFSFMAKAELFEKKLFAFIIRRCGAFPVVRGAGAEAGLQRAFDDIKRGRIFVIFPEGTRSKDGTIGRGKSGVAMIASMANAPVLPVCLMYGLKDEKKRLDFAVGDMIPAEEIAVQNQDRQELKRVSERVMSAIKELQRQILDNTSK